MQTSARDFRANVAGCGELGAMGLVDTSERCEICHSADVAGSLGPCRAALPGGREARVCCAAKRRIVAEKIERRLR